MTEENIIEDTNEEHPAKITLVRKRTRPDGSIIDDHQLEVQGNTLEETEATFNRLKKHIGVR